MNGDDDILIVDDEAANLRLLAGLLEREGYRVRTAERPQMAIDSALAEPPGLILLEVRMQGMDGFEVCRRLKQDARTQDIPVIFLSSVDEIGDRIGDFETGDADLISKPFHELEVLARVRTHMRLRRLQRNLEHLAEERAAELVKSEERFRNLMEQSPLGIAILTPDGKIAQVNSAWMRAWGFDESEAAQVMAEYNMLTDQQAEQLGVMPLVEKAYAGDPVILPPLEYSGNRTLGDIGLEDIEASTIWVQIHLYSIKDEQGAVEYVVSINQDITEQKKAEEEARVHQEALARVERASMMGQLTGSIAHELNQPLTGILSNAQAAELMVENGQLVPEESAKIMAAIAADAKRAGEVIRNLRELYREQKTEFHPIDVNAVVEEATRLLHSELIKQNIALTATCAPSVPMVHGNRIQLEQVLVNLVMNGSEAMSASSEAERRLHIATEHDGNEVKVIVEDCGPGIDPDKIDRVFEPLATWKPGGTGIGLALSHSIILTHGGRMWAENKPGRGARVGFALPAQRSGKGKAPSSAEASADQRVASGDDREHVSFQTGSDSAPLDT